jgi:hypothetical protein
MMKEIKENLNRDISHSWIGKFNIITTGSSTSCSTGSMKSR